MSNLRIDKVPPSPTTLELKPRTVGANTSVYVPVPYNRPVQQGSGSIILEFWQTVKRYRKLILALALVGFAISGIVTLFQTPTYRAFALLEIQSLNEDFLDIKSVDPNASGGQYPVESTVQTQIKIIQSQPIMIRSLDRMNLYTAKRESQTDTVIQGLLAKVGWMKPSQIPSKSLVPAAEDSVRVRPIGPTRIIEVTADSPDPFVATLYVNTIADEYIAQTAAARNISSEKTSVWLRSQLEELRLRLEQAENNLESYARQSNLLFPESSDASTGPSVEQQRMAQLQEELSKAEADRVAKQSNYEQSQSQDPDALPPVLDNGPIRDYQLKLADLKRQRAELEATLKPGHPKVMRVQQQIDDLQATIDHERSNVLARMRNEYDSAKRREDLLKSAYQSESSIVGGQEAKRVRYDTLKREVDSDRQLFEAMLRKVKEADFAKALQASSVRIVNPALIPKEPVTPKIPLNLGLGSALGLFFGIGLAIFKENSNRPLRSPGQSAAELQTRELGVIPRLLASQLPEATNLAASAVNPPTLVKSPVFGLPAIPKTRPGSTFVSESFRSVLQSIMFASQQGKPTRLITITSPEPGDGKTMIASNLAMAMSELRQTVLLIDCDMRRPRLHKVFNIPNGPGISDLLEDGQAKDTGLLTRALRETRFPGLAVIPSGEPGESIPYLLNSDRLNHLLQSFREQFDMVIIDSPPMLFSPDARILGKNSDGVLLVVRAGKTSSSVAHSARECLAEDNISLIGTVLNDWNASESKSYKSYKQYYS
jgi:capsular exopolysaccharide synthesis family protein